MSNLEKYNQVFKETFGIDDNSLKGLVYTGIPAWDSVGHMELISKFEDTFGISIEVDDIIDFSSYEKGKEILKKYNIIID